MDMPRPTQAHDARQVMVGAWEGEETIHPSPFEEAGGAGYTYRMEVSHRRQRVVRVSRGALSPEPTCHC